MTRKRFIATENQLSSCRQLLANSHMRLQAIQAAECSGCGIYKRILECREMAERVRRLMSSGDCADSQMLLDHLAYMDGWLRHLASTLPQDVNSRHLVHAVMDGDVQDIYRGTHWAVHRQERRA
ncbi:hypothetical protein P4S07_023435 [Serratia marcescens]|uniref:hypothetical protein n=1 Tax=Serratia marcescens TaxID=615 RepID=UPI0024076882|nr:hypothetical protein [Serratia marcescens]MDF9722716.1 hypothetical protein [Serratia marcescens]